MWSGNCFILVVLYFVTQNEETTPSNLPEICMDHTVCLLDHYRSISSLAWLQCLWKHKFPHLCIVHASVLRPLDCFPPCHQFRLLQWSKLSGKYTATFFSSLDTDQTEVTPRVSTDEPKEIPTVKWAATEVWWWELNFNWYSVFCLQNTCASHQVYLRILNTRTDEKNW